MTDENYKYSAVPVPRRAQQPESRPVAEAAVEAGALRNGAGYAEIEYEVRQDPPLPGYPGVKNAVRLPEAVSSAPRNSDPVRKKFEDMRSITSGNPFSRNDSGYFYRQAQFMESFTDDYRNSADFFMYYPSYQMMSYNQLRTYFTWRTKVRSGNVAVVPLSYAFLYIYELLSGIGVSSPADGLKMLINIWEAFRPGTRTLDYYLPGWLYDYHIYYDLPASFSDFIAEHDFSHYYYDQMLFDPESANSLEAWNRISSYDVTKSRFYTDGNSDAMQNCFSRVVREIAQRCSDGGFFVYDLISRNYDNMTAWRPFQRALFHNWLDQPDRRAEMIGERVYECRNNHWTTNISLPYAWRKDLAAYLLKRTEMCMRQAVKYKYKLNADPAAVKQRIHAMKAPRFEFDQLDAAITDAVGAFYREANRTVVTVDHVNLARIRAEALGTQEALIVPDEASQHQAQASNSSAAAVSPLPAAHREHMEANEALSQDDSLCGLPYPEHREANEALSPDDSLHGLPYPERAEEDEPSSPFVAPGVPEGWNALADALSGAELKALQMLSIGRVDITAIAAETGLMPEVLVDNINEKSMDFIGDSILAFEDEISVYAEYREIVENLIWRA